jgi:hypothetical protein
MKISTKKLLVNYIIANGNPGITRTELIKAILHLKFGSKVKYDRELYRGYYSGPISGINNYFLNGSGECGFVKVNGLYYAQYFTIEERRHRAINLFEHKKAIFTTRCWSKSYVDNLMNKATKTLHNSIMRLEKESAS